MNTPTKLNRWIVWPAVAVLVAVVLVACGGGDGERSPSTTQERTASYSKASSTPAVSWSPASITQDIQPGETRTFTATLTALSAIPGGVIRVVPELASFVTVSPLTTGPLATNERISVVLTLHVPTTAFPVLATGTIQLREANDSNNVVAKPLPVMVNVAWTRTTGLPGGIAFSYPSFGQASFVKVSHGSDESMGIRVSVGATESTASTQFLMGITPNPGALSLLDWFSNNIDITGSISARGLIQTTTLPNGIETLRVRGDLPQAHLNAFGPIESVYARAQDGSRIISLVGVQDPLFVAMGASRAERDRYHDAILDSLSF